MKLGGFPGGIGGVLLEGRVKEDLLGFRDAVGEGGPEFRGDLPGSHLLVLRFDVPFRSAFSKASASDLDSFTLVCPSIRALSIRLCA